MLWVSISASAYDFEVDGFYYEANVENMTATLVAGEQPYSGVVSVPATATYKGRVFSVTAINGAFSGNTTLTQVTIPTSVTSLGKKTFFGCVGLQKVQGLDNIEEFEDSCFAGCTALTTLPFPAKLKSLGKATFANCDALSDILLPDSIALIPEACFNGCASLKHIEIPSLTKTIGGDAFAGCASLDSISIPGAVESIGNGVFKGCSGIMSVTFEKGATTINCGLNQVYVHGVYKPTPLFEDCNIQKAIIKRNISSSYKSTYMNGQFGCFTNSTVSSVTLSDDVTKIEAGAFKGCSKLSNIIIPSSVTHIEDYAFYNSGLDSIIIEDGRSSLSFGISVYYDGNYSDKYRPHTFYGTNIKSAYIGRNIETYQNGKLEHYDYPLYIFFPTTLEELSVGDYVTDIEKLLNTNISASNSLSHYPNLKKVQFGTNLTKLPSLAKNESLVKLSMTSNVPPVAEPFSNSQYMDLLVEVPTACSDAYKAADVWKKFWEISENASLLTFFEVDGIKYHILSDGKSVDVVGGNDSLRQITIPEAVVFADKTYDIASIDEGAFSEKKCLEMVTLNCNVQEIKSKTFMNCTNLATIKLPSTIEKINDNAFNGCESLNTFNCPNSLVYIGDYAFWRCSLESVDIPNSVENIGKCAFDNDLYNLVICDGKTPLYFPYGSKDEGTGVQKKEVNGKTILYKIVYYNGFWSYCYDMTKVYIGRSLASNSRYTISGDGGVDVYVITSYDGPFANLSKLKELTIGENVETLGPTKEYIKEIDMYVSAGSFKYCSSLDTVVVKATTPPTGAEFSATTYAKAQLIVPDNALALYQAADGWKEFQHIVTESATLIENVSKDEGANSLRLNANGFTLASGKPMQVRVYSIDGSLYYSALMQPQQSASLSPGMYIIKVDGKVVKVKI